MDGTAQVTRHRHRHGDLSKESIAGRIYRNMSAAEANDPVTGLRK